MLPDPRSDVEASSERRSSSEEKQKIEEKLASRPVAGGARDQAGAQSGRRLGSRRTRRYTPQPQECAHRHRRLRAPQALPADRRAAGRRPVRSRATRRTRCRHGETQIVAAARRNKRIRKAPTRRRRSRPDLFQLDRQGPVSTAASCAHRRETRSMRRHWRSWRAPQPFPRRRGIIGTAWST